MAKSRAEYFRKRRETRGQFMVMVEKETLEQFNDKLKQIGKTKTEWLRDKIEEELNDGRNTDWNTDCDGNGCSVFRNT